MLLHAHVGSMQTDGVSVKKKQLASFFFFYRSMQTDGVSALGNMALRMPENCAAIAECGGIPAIVSALSQHLALPRMQSKASEQPRYAEIRREERLR